MLGVLFQDCFRAFEASLVLLCLVAALHDAFRQTERDRGTETAREGEGEEGRDGEEGRKRGRKRGRKGEEGREVQRQSEEEIRTATRVCVCARAY